MSGNFFDLIEEQYGWKYKCSEEEFRYIERLWIDAGKSLDRIVDFARYIDQEKTRASVELCKECINEINRLLASDCDKNFIGDAGAGGHDLTKLLAKASEIYAASINKNLRTLIRKVSSIEELQHKKNNFPKEAPRKMEIFCKHQADVSYSAAEISAYFKNLVRSLKNKK